MKKYLTNTLGMEFTLEFARAWGVTKNIDIVVMDGNTGLAKAFIAPRCDQQSIDVACRLDGQEKWEALFEVAEHKIADDIEKWMYGNLPEEVRRIIESHGKDDFTYEECEALNEELQCFGYTMDYGLDAVPFGLKRIK